MKLTLRKSDWLDDWYVIERKEHENKQWLKPTHGGFAFQRSSRISDADVEGTAEEMLAIAQSIKAKGRKSFKRCSVCYVSDNEVQFCSPRNSQRDGICNYEEALELANAIEAMLSSAQEATP